MKRNLMSVLFITLILTGCATTGRGLKSQEYKSLQCKVANLETELREKDRLISELEYQLEEKKAEPAKPAYITPSKKAVSQKSEKKKTYKKTPERIQKALKNAGFYKGPIDSKIGKNTKKAISDFQKANGITSDGVVGKKTWSKLSKFLE
ncbi:MAG: peptidoglycan-binding domain-containing protein [Candidatus Omnitrophota bacterium]